LTLFERQIGDGPEAHVPPLVRIGSLRRIPYSIERCIDQRLDVDRSTRMLVFHRSINFPRRSRPRRPTLLSSAAAST
jgi:hypothetical protein